MASDRKSDKKTKRASSPPLSEEGRIKRKRHRTGEDDDRPKGSSGTSRSEKKRHSKSEKHSKRHSDKGKRSKEERKSKHSEHGGHLKAKLIEITEDDYFSKNNEFATWLKEEKKKFFSDLTSTSSRKLFSKFVEEWNNEKLDSKYYEGIASGPRSAHNWKIK